MQRLDLRQSLGQKLSPQQIQFIKLLQIPTTELEMRVKEEGDEALDNEDNILDEDYQGSEGNDLDSDLPTAEAPDERLNEQEVDSEREHDDVNLDDYLHDDEIAGYKMQGDSGGDEVERES